MTARTMSMSMISDRQALALGVIALGVLWYATSQAGGAVDKLRDVLFGPKLPPPIKITPSANLSAEQYIKMGYATRDKNGTFRITPLGQMYIDRMAKQESQNVGRMGLDMEKGRKL